MDQKPVRMFLRQRLAELLQRPFSTRMRRHIVMQDLAPAQFHDHQYINDTESRAQISLLRQREDVHGVAATGRVRLRSQAYTEGSDRAATSRDGDVLASVDRIRHRGLFTSSKC